MGKSLGGYRAITITSCRAPGPYRSVLATARHRAQIPADGLPTRRPGVGFHRLRTDARHYRDFVPARSMNGRPHGDDTSTDRCLKLSDMAWSRRCAIPWQVAERALSGVSASPDHSTALA